MSTSVAFLGLGVMGGPMAANLAQAGFTVTGWNRTPEKPGVNFARERGVAITNSISDAVQAADVIFSCLGDVPDVEEVLLGPGGVSASARSGALMIEMSTIGSPAAKSLAKGLTTKDIAFLDAPVSGGDVGAKAGTLTIMVGGQPTDFEQAMPYFQALGKNIRLCGPVGRGQAVKMCNQVLCALNMVGLCEALELAQQQGLDPNLLVEVCGTGAAGSWTLSNLGPRLMKDDLAPGFMIRHILKDLRLVMESSQTELPGLVLANQLFQQVGALDSGAAQEQGTQAMIRAYRELS
ncbi:MAG: NAD(P)-dependent oxidoreductase [Cyanobacteria bacterium P01_H01_bin.15]